MNSSEYVFTQGFEHTLSLRERPSGLHWLHIVVLSDTGVIYHNHALESTFIKIARFCRLYLNLLRESHISHQRLDHTRLAIRENWIKTLTE